MNSTVDNFLELSLGTAVSFVESSLSICALMSSKSKLQTEPWSFSSSESNLSFSVSGLWSSVCLN